ncbi:MAG: LLM class F420-dependent oxidoreductase [Thermodesulfobacteriota bacterium]
MKFGIAVPNFGDYAKREEILEISALAEELRYDSLWVSDHVIIPNSHEGFGDTFLDPFIALTYIAAITKIIELGTSVIILPYRNPIVLAKMVSTLDCLSRGRVVLGVGAGWLEGEFDALGVPFKERGAVTDEYIEIIKELWTSETPHYKGKYHEFSNLMFSPKPHRKPNPPIWVGGGSKRAIERAVRHGDGWHPVGYTPSELREKADYLNSLLSDEKRDNFVISLRRNLEIDEDKEFKADDTLRGGREKIVKGIREYSAAGATHMILYILAIDFKGILKTLRVFAEEIRPDFG